ANPELVFQILRYKWCTAGNQYFVVRRKCRFSNISIAIKTAGFVSHFFKQHFAFVVQRLLPLNSKNFKPKLSQNRSLIATSRANLKHLFSFFRLEQRGLKSYRIRLRNGLSASNRKRFIDISQVQKSGVEKEQMTRNGHH